MARFARLVIPGIPHHVTQRGNRRQTTFFEKEDYEIYKDCLAQICKQYQVKIWCYCLMINHVHLIAVPSSEESLSKAMGRGHEMYSRYINHKKKWSGLLWQNRFGSYPMDERHLYNCCKYIELNPVVTGLASRAEFYPWSSARAHLGLNKDDFICSDTLDFLIDDWAEYLSEGVEKETITQIKRHQNNGRPLGTNTFVRNLEKISGRKLRPKKPGPKPKA